MRNRFSCSDRVRVQRCAHRGVVLQVRFSNRHVTRRIGTKLPDTRDGKSDKPKAEIVVNLTNALAVGVLLLVEL